MPHSIRSLHCTLFRFNHSLVFTDFPILVYSTVSHLPICYSVKSCDLAAILQGGVTNSPGEAQNVHENVTLWKYTATEAGRQAMKYIEPQ